jgi:hypothetical protein
MALSWPSWDTRRAFATSRRRTAVHKISCQVVVAALTLIMPLLSANQAAAAAHWGRYSYTCLVGCCNQPNCVPWTRYSSILWDIPSGKSWDWYCKNTPGYGGLYPTRCVNLANEWGEWDVQDSRCMNFCKVGGAWPFRRNWSPMPGPQCCKQYGTWHCPCPKP